MSYKETVDLWVYLLAPHEDEEYEIEVLTSFECTVHGWIGDGRDEPRQFEYDVDKISLVKWEPHTVPFSPNQILVMVENEDYEDELYERLVELNSEEDPGDED